MAIDVLFKFLKIVIMREPTKRKRVTQFGSAIEEILGVEVAVATPAVKGCNRDASLEVRLNTCIRGTR